MGSRSVVGKPISLRIPCLDEGRCCMNYELIPEFVVDTGIPTAS
jgi:hypothetical protein